MLFAWVPDRAFPADRLDGVETPSAWDPIRPSGTVQFEVTGQGTVDVRIAADLTPPLEPKDGSRPGLFETVLWVETDELRVPVPITVVPAQTAHDVVGLWVGEVLVREVSVAATGELQPVPQPFAMRFIVHVSAGGECRLLSEARLVQKRDPHDQEAPRHRVVEPQSRIPLAGREESTLHQVRTVAYAVDEPVPGETAGTGTCLSPGASASFTLKLGYRHRLNPDVHATHPDHDNLDEAYRQVLEEGVEARTVIRRWILVPDAEAGHQGPPFVRGHERIDGRFEEQIEGVHSTPLQTAGRFRLRRITRAPLEAK